MKFKTLTWQVCTVYAHLNLRGVRQRIEKIPDNFDFLTKKLIFDATIIIKFNKIRRANGDY